MFVVYTCVVCFINEAMYLVNLESFVADCVSCEHFLLKLCLCLCKVLLFAGFRHLFLCYAVIFSFLL